MSRCPTCKTEFDRGEQFCPLDGSPLKGLPVGEDALTGRVLGGRYRLTERLGQGGMGTVYRAVHTLMDKPVAVKILRGELSTDAEAVARFHREARSASRLDHDHCIRVSDFGQSDDGLLYLAMELLEGRSLGQRMREGRIPIGEAAAIAHSIALALEHAHEAGVVHRDLKPDNVFLARRSRGREVVKVLDFGLAKLASDSGRSRSITRDGTVFGTPEYMAPEQAQGDPLDARTDLYSLGVVLYHLLTGELPFRGETFVAVLTKHVRETPRRPRDLDPTIPETLEAIVLRCLKKRPDDRFPSATALAEALAPLGTRGDATGPVGTPVGEARSGPITVEPASGPISSSDSLDSIAAQLEPVRRSRRGLVLVAVAALGALGFAALRPRREVPPTTTTAAAPALNEPPTAAVMRMVAAGKLEEAAAELEVLHRSGESAALERLTAEVAEKRGQRLKALAHMHRAKTLAPSDATIRQALAALLLRLGQKGDACRQAGQAVARAQSDPNTLAAARGILRTASCDSKPPQAPSPTIDPQTEGPP